MNPQPKRRTVADCAVITLPKMIDPRGNLTFIEGGHHIPFEIRRIFYIYDVPTEADRGAHAHRNLQQFIICLAGSFDVALDDGRERRSVHLNRPWSGLLIPSMIWSAEVNFDSSSVCLVLTSDVYREDDYIRDYDEYLRLNDA